MIKIIQFYKPVKTYQSYQMFNKIQKKKMIKLSSAH